MDGLIIFHIPNYILRNFNTAHTTLYSSLNFTIQKNRTQRSLAPKRTRLCQSNACHRARGPPLAPLVHCVPRERRTPNCSAGAQASRKTYKVERHQLWPSL